MAAGATIASDLSLFFSGGANLTTSSPTSSASRLSASVADAASGTETTTPAAETNKYLASSVALLYETTTEWNTVGETSLSGVATTLPTSSSPEASTGFLSSSVALLSDTTTPRRTLGETSLSGVATTLPSSSSPEASTEFLSSSVALLYETTTAWNTIGETSLSGVATTLPSSSSPEASTPVGISNVSPSSSSLEMTSISSTGFGHPSEERTTHPAESTMLSIGSTTEEMNSSPPSPQDERTSEVPSTIISITSQGESTSEKHPSSPSFTDTMKTSPLLVPLSTPRVATSTLLSTPSGVGDTTREVTTSSEAKITSWWPGSSPSSTFSLVTQDRSTSKVISTGLLSSKPGKTSLGRPAPPSTNPTSENSTTALKVLSSTTTSSSASKALPKTPARSRFILSVRLSTSLNITDPSVTHAVRKWFNQELQAKFPVFSFNLTWIG
ncbi:mucin-5AC-like [Notechis scutatus]|uniref:Mucin-5AC-like n=1 Tax=Notechis scutatus TaxID=8663 RepID=A0A6J1W992_9SAUR|nr:mucin-5AC-like [Notechis scutatus]